MALHDDAAFVIDAVQGVVRQLDPRTLNPVGEPLRYPARHHRRILRRGWPALGGGAERGHGLRDQARADPVEATARMAAGQAPPPSARSPSPQPNNDLTLSALDDGVAVLDRTTNALTIVRGDEQRDDSR